MSIICFGYPKLTFNISMLFSVDVLITQTVFLKQSAYRNRGLFEADIETYRGIILGIVLV